MGIILDSSAVIAAERRREIALQFLENIRLQIGEQIVALSSIGVAELVHGIYRAQTPEIRARREAFINDLVSAVPTHPFSTRAAFLAGKTNGEQQAKGVVIPFGDSKSATFPIDTRTHSSNALKNSSV